MSTRLYLQYAVFEGLLIASCLEVIKTVPEYSYWWVGLVSLAAAAATGAIRYLAAIFTGSSSGNLFEQMHDLAAQLGGIVAIPSSLALAAAHRFGYLPGSNIVSLDNTTALAVYGMCFSVFLAKRLQNKDVDMIAQGPAILFVIGCCIRDLMQGGSDKSIMLLVGIVGLAASDDISKGIHKNVHKYLNKDDVVHTIMAGAVYCFGRSM